MQLDLEPSKISGIAFVVQFVFRMDSGRPIVNFHGNQGIKVYGEWRTHAS